MDLLKEYTNYKLKKAYNFYKKNCSSSSIDIVDQLCSSVNFYSDWVYSEKAELMYGYYKKEKLQNIESYLLQINRASGDDLIAIDKYMRSIQDNNICNLFRIEKCIRRIKLLFIKDNDNKDESYKENTKAIIDLLKDRDPIQNYQKLLQAKKK